MQQKGEFLIRQLVLWQTRVCQFGAPLGYVYDESNTRPALLGPKVGAYSGHVQAEVVGLLDELNLRFDLFEPFSHDPNKIQYRRRLAGAPFALLVRYTGDRATLQLELK